MKDAAMVSAGAVLLIAAATLTIVLATSPEPPPESDDCWHHPEERAGEAFWSNAYVDKYGELEDEEPLNYRHVRKGEVAFGADGRVLDYMVPIFVGRDQLAERTGEQCSVLEREWGRKTWVKAPPCIVWRSDGDCAGYGTPGKGTP